MATFIKEDNSNIQSKPVLRLNKRQKQELVKNGLSMLDSNSLGYKTIGRFIDPNYNKKNKNAKTAGLDSDEVALGDAKKIVHTYEKIGNLDKNDPSYKAMEPILRPLKDGIKKTRAKYSKQPQAPKPPSTNNIKPKSGKTPNTEVKPPKVNSLTESYDHEFYEYLEEYGAREVFEMYRNGETAWVGLINPESYKQALREFMQYGEIIRFPKQKIYQWFGTVMRNTAILGTITSIAGHTQYAPLEEFLDEFFYDDEIGDIDYDAWERYKEEEGGNSDYSAMIEYLDSLNPPFFDWCQMPDGSDPWSDYGLDPLHEIIKEYNENKTPEEVLVLLNRALDVVHQRGDLASIFIVGGRKTLSQISEDVKRNKKTVIITEKQLRLLQDILNEGRNADKAKAKTLEVIRDYFNNASWLDNEFRDEAANPNHLSVIDYIENKLKDICFHANIPDSIIRLEPIIMNIALGLGFEQGSIEDTQKLNRLYRIVEFIKKGQQKGILPIALNKLTLENTTYDTLNDVFGTIIDDEDAAERERINNADYSQGMNPNYEIIYNVDFETAAKYGAHSCSNSRLCYTESKGTWDDYTKNGSNKVFILLRKDWREVPEKHGENTPYDDYGLSMIFLFVNRFGELEYSNTRWNHETEGQGPRNVDQSFTKEQISQLLNVNFNQTFAKGAKKFEEIANEVLECVEKGDSLKGIVDDFNYLTNNMVKIKIGNKFNIIDRRQKRYIVDEWFDLMGTSFMDRDKVIVVGYKKPDAIKMNLVDDEGKFISDIWFNSIKSDFRFLNNTACLVMLGNKMNLMKRDGTLFYDQWPFNYIGVSTGGYSIVLGDYGWNFMNTNTGEIVSSTWFDSHLGSYRVSKHGIVYDFNPENSIGIADDVRMVREGIYLRLLRDFKKQTYNYYLDNKSILFPDTWFEYAKIFEERDSEEYYNAIAELYRLEDTLNNVRTNREYDHITSEMERVKREARNLKYRALVVIDAEKYLIDLNGNLFDASTKQWVKTIPVNKSCPIFSE